MKVTGFIRHDVYPYYQVVHGDLQDNFDLKCDHAVYNHVRVLAVKPFIEYEAHRQNLICIKDAYRCRKKDLEVALLNEFDVHFLKIK